MVPTSLEQYVPPQVPPIRTPPLHHVQESNLVTLATRSQSRPQNLSLLPQQHTHPPIRTLRYLQALPPHRRMPAPPHRGLVIVNRIIRARPSTT